MLAASSASRQVGIWCFHWYFQLSMNELQTIALTLSKPFCLILILYDNLSCIITDCLCYSRMPQYIHPLPCWSNSVSCLNMTFLFPVFDQFVLVFWRVQSATSFQVTFVHFYIHELLVIFFALGLAIVVGNDDDGLPLFVGNNSCNLYFLLSNLSVGNLLFTCCLEYFWLWPSWTIQDILYTFGQLM